MLWQPILNYKNTKEIREKAKTPSHDEEGFKPIDIRYLPQATAQVLIIGFIF